jgi:uncharacterized protein (DUF2147 family)
MQQIVRIMRRHRSIALGLSLMAASAATSWAAPEGVIGNWMTSTGSIVTVAECGPDLCLTVAKVSPKAAASTDVQNPDATLRDHPLCGLKIGDGFKVDGPNTASGGHIYDPESGKTYNGKMERKGDTLKLRGFIGVSVFGRTEIWTLTSAPPACK